MYGSCCLSIKRLLNLLVINRGNVSLLSLTVSLLPFFLLLWQGPVHLKELNPQYLCLPSYVCQISPGPNYDYYSSTMRFTISSPVVREAYMTPFWRLDCLSCFLWSINYHLVLSQLTTSCLILLSFKASTKMDFRGSSYLQIEGLAIIGSH